MVKVRPAAILASSRCLKVAAPLEGAQLAAEPDVEKAINDAYLSFSQWSPPAGWDPVRLSLWYATVYGGLVLMYTCGPITPISRVTTSVGIDITATNDMPQRALDDSKVLAAWAKLWAGNEEEGLKELEGPLEFPRGHSWRAGGPIKIATRGVMY
ncbi:hypothetical protein [Acidilobus sp.]|uniref:hypothetical protein n=1 Tax=Acidilobus sp. TaxID=1872109 RepID=UPI003D02E2A8